MGTFLLEFGEFLVDHYDVINAIKQALEAGRSKEDIMAGIRGAEVAASDAVVEAELGPRP